VPTVRTPSELLARTESLQTERSIVLTMADRAGQRRTELSVSLAVYMNCDMCTNIALNDHCINTTRNCNIFQHLNGKCRH
jgi:hypothetical protein